MNEWIGADLDSCIQDVIIAKRDSYFLGKGKLPRLREEKRLKQQVLQKQREGNINSIGGGSLVLKLSLA